MAVKIVRISPKNPLDWALDKLGMTRVELEVSGPYNKSFLLRLSQGRHSRMGERVTGDLYNLAKDKGIDLDTELLGIYGPATSLEEAYDHWCILHRRAQTLPQPTREANVNPFMRLVHAVGSVARMSALLAAPDQLVDRYAKGVTYVMPLPVMTALVDMEYPHTDQLADAMEKWGANHHA